MTTTAPHQTSHLGTYQLSRKLHSLMNRSAIPCPFMQATSADIVAGVAEGLGIGSFTIKDVAYGGVYDASAAAGSRLTDDTTDINDAGAADALAMPATEAAGDRLVLGLDPDSGMPFGIRIILSTAGIGGTITMKYLASNGVWTAFAKVVDGSTGLTAGTSTYDILFQVPQDWVPMAFDEPADAGIDSGTAERYYLAIEVATTYSTNPAVTRVSGLQAAAANVTGAIIANATGVIDTITYLATAGATNNDTILQVINHTRKTRGLVTLTGNPARGRFTFSTALYVDRGDELTLHAVQVDGTTEILNWTDAYFEIKQ